MKIDQVRNENPKIYVLVGLPASGKSTWTKNKLDSSPYRFDVISSDGIIERIAKEQGKTYSEMFQETAACANSQIWEDFRESLKNGNNIIWDQTNMTSKKRRKILSQLPKKYEKIAVLFEVEREELTRRLDERAKREGKFIPKHVIESMLDSYQEPVVDEGFDKVEIVE